MKRTQNTNENIEDEWKALNLKFQKKKGNENKNSLKSFQWSTTCLFGSLIAFDFLITSSSDF